MFMESFGNFFSIFSKHILSNCSSYDCNLLMIFLYSVSGLSFTQISRRKYFRSRFFVNISEAGSSKIPRQISVHTGISLTVCWQFPKKFFRLFHKEFLRSSVWKTFLFRIILEIYFQAVIIVLFF